MKFKLVLKSLSLIIMSCFLQVACDHQNFTTLPSEKCIEANKSPNVSGEFTEDGTCLYKQFHKTGKVDIVFVIDNSKSMYTEQQRLSSSFSKLIRSIWHLDFKIAITTTDITKAPAANGQFVTLSNGQKTLSNRSGLSESELNSIFTDSITRKETLDCELGSGQCPSGDVRAIYSANLVMTKNKSFFREGAHSAFIVLSDADSRVFGLESGRYALNTNWDTPKSLVAKLSELSSSKTLSFHSIIINPGDEDNRFPNDYSIEMQQDVACYNIQNNQSASVNGYYGREYFKASKPSPDLLALGNLLPGTIGSICDADYSQILNNISSSVKTSLKTIALRCTDPLNLDVYYTNNKNSKIDFSVSSHKIILNSDIPSGSDITIEMECPNIH